MPIKKKSSSKVKSGKTTHSQKQSRTKNSLIDLINKLTEISKSKSKSQSNLPAHLQSLKISNRPPHFDRKLFSNSYSKSVSSIYSSVEHDGHKHSKGKKVINNSKKPYIEIAELQNDKIDHYIVPKHTIPYKQPINQTPQLTIEMSEEILKPTMILTKGKKSTKKSVKKPSKKSGKKSSKK